MQNRALMLILCATAACAPYSGYYQAGQTVARLNADQTTCEVQAAQKVPPNTQIRRTPVTVSPPQRVCNEAGDCVVYPGQVSGGDAYTVDTNLPLRQRVEDQCMGAKGYQKVQIPLCTPQVSKAIEGRAITTLPPLNDRVCAARTQSRDYVFVTVN